MDPKKDDLLSSLSKIRLERDSQIKAQEICMEASFVKEADLESNALTVDEPRLVRLIAEALKELSRDE